MNRSETIIGSVLAVIFMLAGIGLISLGSSLHLQRSRLIADGRSATGVIVRFERIGPGADDPVGDTLLVPVVRFNDEFGTEFTFQGSMAQPFWADFQSGEEVAVVYDPTNPHEARIDTYAEIWFAPLMCWLIGGAAVLIPPLTIWRHYRTDHGRGPLQASP